MKTDKKLRFKYYIYCIQNWCNTQQAESVFRPCVLCRS